MILMGYLCLITKRICELLGCTVVPIQEKPIINIVQTVLLSDHFRSFNDPCFFFQITDWRVKHLAKVPGTLVA